MKGKRCDYSPEEIIAMIDRNENFHGKQADIAKLRQYQEIKESVTAFKQNCDEVKGIEYDDPDKSRMNATVYVDFGDFCTFDKEETAMLTAIMGKADRIVTAAGKKGMRFSFCVEGIWNE